MPEFSVVHELYRARDVASLFSVTPRCVRNWYDSGKLEAVCLTTHVVVITGMSVRNWVTAWKR